MNTYSLKHLHHHHHNIIATAMTIDYVPPNAGTLLSSEQEQGWQTVHSPWQGLQLGTAAS